MEANQVHCTWCGRWLKGKWSMIRQNWTLPAHHHQNPPKHRELIAGADRLRGYPSPWCPAGGDEV